jgi:hypothetical protein
MRKSGKEREGAGRGAKLDAGGVVVWAAGGMCWGWRTVFCRQEVEAVVAGAGDAYMVDALMMLQASSRRWHSECIGRCISWQCGGGLSGALANRINASQATSVQWQSGPACSIEGLGVI